MECAGHVNRMEESRIPKRIMDGRIYGGRPVGRSRDRWLDAVTVDARLFLKKSLEKAGTRYRRMEEDGGGG